MVVPEEMFEKINVNTTSTITDISFLDENHGIICGSFSFLATTSNGGQSWHSLNVGTSQSFLSTCILSEQKIYTARLGLFASTNGGTSFNEIGNLSAGSSIFAFKFYNESDGLVLRGGSILKSSDGGNTWEEKFNTNTYSSLGNIQTPSPQIIYVSGGTAYDDVNVGLIVKSTDGGETWNTVWTTNSEIESISFLSDEIGYYVDVDNNIYKTMDGSNTWVHVTTIPNYPLDVCFRSENVGYISTYEGQILMTENGGSTWKTVYDKTQEPIVKIISVGNVIYAVGNDGLFLKKG